MSHHWGIFDQLFWLVSKTLEVMQVDVILGGS
jgi:hypothetical protein